MVKRRSRNRRMDRKLAARLQPWEVSYIAKRFKVTVRVVRNAIAKVGHSRRRLYAYLRC